jgi:uncharacterized protein YebE (UPF0316 family)
MLSWDLIMGSSPGKEGILQVVLKQRRQANEFAFRPLDFSLHSSSVPPADLYGYGRVGNGALQSPVVTALLQTGMMNMPPITPEAVGFAVLIFMLRVLNYAISTVRTVAIAKQQKLFASMLAFVEALVFAVAIANVISDLDNPLNLIAYCLGASAGGYLGMTLEPRLIQSYVVVSIIAHDKAKVLAEALREKGHGVTELTGVGRDGTVQMLRSMISSRDLKEIKLLVQQIDPQAFITVEDTRSIEQGWLKTPRSTAPFRRLGG